MFIGGGCFLWMMTYKRSWCSLKTPPFSIGQVSISGGIGGSLSTDKTKYMLADINGDGLPDKLLHGGTQVFVSYNKGYSFGNWIVLSGVSELGRNYTENFSTTLLGLLVDLLSSG